MKKVIAHLTSLAFLFLLSIPARTQSVGEQLTLRERREAQRLISTFVTRLEETMDWQEAMRGLVADDWLTNSLKDKNIDESALLGVPRELAENFPIDFQRFYLAFLRLGYLYILNCSSLPDDHEDDECWPPEVMQAERSDPRMAMLMSGDSKIESVDQLREDTGTVEKLTALLQRPLIKLRSERGDDYWKAVSKVKRQSALKPSLENCAEGCYGFPAGTRLIGFTLMPFYVLMADVQGQMKIVAIVIYDD